MGFCEEVLDQKCYTELQIRTWSEVVYEGMEVYSKFLILLESGISGESV